VQLRRGQVLVSRESVNRPNGRPQHPKMGANRVAKHGGPLLNGTALCAARRTKPCT
jgi:hypothetical protein